MTGYSQHQDLMDLWSRFCDDVITENELRRLVEMLTRDDGSKEQFVAYLSMHADLNWLEGAHRSTQGSALQG